MDIDELAARYYVDYLTAYVRGRLGLPGVVSTVDAWGAAQQADLRIHRFKRSAGLPRVQRVLGVLRGLAPSSLLDVGSGRGTFLWPLLEALPDLPVLAVDRDAIRARDLGAVHRGGLARLRAARMDVQQLALDDDCMDVATILEVLEHLPDPPSAAREALRVARRFVVASVPSKPDTNPEHIHLFDRAALERLWAQAGARRVQVDFVLNHAIALVTK